MSRKSRLYGLVGAVGVVVGLGDYVGNLYSDNLATFGMIAIFILGGAVIRFQGPED